MVVTSVFSFFQSLLAALPFSIRGIFEVYFHTKIQNQPEIAEKKLGHVYIDLLQITGTWNSIDNMCVCIYYLKISKPVNNWNGFLCPAK